MDHRFQVEISKGNTKASYVLKMTQNLKKKKDSLLPKVTSFSPVDNWFLWTYSISFQSNENIPSKEEFAFDKS